MDLDRFDHFARLDTNGILRNIEEFPAQLETAWLEADNLSMPAHFVQSNHIVLLGVGANLVANLLIQFLTQNSTIPVTVWNNPGIPSFVNGKTLVIASSYSGNTEETVTAFEEAANLGAKLLVISSGGKLGAFARKYKAPFYEINYGSEPRVSLGYFIASLYRIAMKIGIIEKNPDAIPEAAALVKGFLQKIKSDVVLSKNSSKQLALRLKSKIPVTVGNNTLLPVAIRFSNQLNEMALTTSFHQPLWELRHHSIRGINYPPKLSEKIIYILFTSKFSSRQDKEVLEEVLRLFDRRGIPYEVIAIEPPGSKLAEALCSIQLSDYTAYYLSILNDNNPQSEAEL